MSLALSNARKRMPFCCVAELRVAQVLRIARHHPSPLSQSEVAVAVAFQTNTGEGRAVGCGRLLCASVELPHRVAFPPQFGVSSRPSPRLKTLPPCEGQRRRCPSNHKSTCRMLTCAPPLHYKAQPSLKSSPTTPDIKLTSSLTCASVPGNGPAPAPAPAPAHHPASSPS